jgi:hypothetical protein
VGQIPSEQGFDFPVEFQRWQKLSARLLRAPVTASILIAVIGERPMKLWPHVLILTFCGSVSLGAADSSLKPNPTPTPTLDQEYLVCAFGPKSGDSCGQPSRNAEYRCGTDPTAEAADICTIHRPSGDQHVPFSWRPLDSGKGGSCGWRRDYVTCHLLEEAVGTQVIVADNCESHTKLAEDYCSKYLKAHSYRVFPVVNRGGGRCGKYTLRVICYADP